jgi:ubiquinone biosynthesis protein COQ9
MKRSVVLSVVIGSLILVMSLGANAYQHSQIKQAQQQISRLQQQKRQVSQQLTKVKQQKQLLSTQIDS